MSFEVPPVTGVEPSLSTPTTQRTDKPLAATTREDDAVHVDMIPASPPAELHDQIDAASQRVDDLQAKGRELHFSLDESSKRVVIEVRDTKGNVLSTIPPSKALDVVSGGDLD
ncbi:MAG TPA: flagellar protein FlaG [Thermoleophilaceae bacterium]|jgi:flagellar protein FlaG